MENLFFFGIGGVLITFLIGLMKARAYNIENQDAMARTQRLLCFSYTAFLRLYA